MFPYSVEHFLISFWELPLILPVVRFSDTRLSYWGFRPPRPDNSTFFFVPLDGLTDALGRFNLPAHLLREAANQSTLLRE